MALMGIGDYFKYLSLGVVMCGVIASPIAMASLGGGISSIKLPSELHLGKQVSSKGSNTNQQELSLTTKQLFDSVKEGGEKDYKFSDVTMKFGNYQLKNNDVLFSPNQDGTYYLARADRNNYYILEGGERVYGLFKRHFEGKNYKNIQLKWNSNNGGMSLSTIVLSTCNFKVTNKTSNKQLTITCSQFRGNALGAKIFTTIKESDFRQFID